MLLLNRIPKKEQIIPVYSVGVTILYFWAILNAIRDLIRNWSLYLSVSEMLGLFSYIMAGTFLESLLLILVLLVVSFILPPTIFADKFVLRGTILTITLLGSIVYLYQLTLTFGILENIGKYIVFFMSFTCIFMVFGELNQFVAQLVKSTAERCVIFLYIYLPLSFISLIVIFARNVS